MRLATLVALAMLASCSAKTGELKNSLSKVEGFCAEWAKRACNEEVVSRCSSASVEACRGAQQSYCETLVTDGEYSSRTAKGCLDAVGKAYENTELTPEERDVVRKLGGACDKIASGTGGEGDPCTETKDCNRDIELACVKKGAASEGTCQTPEVLTGGLDCSAANAVCEDGFYCNGENCIAGKRESAVCTANEPCGTDLLCTGADGAPVGTEPGDAGMPTGTCTPKKSVGEDCNTDADCTTALCSPRVGSDVGLCTAKIVLAPTEPTCIDLQ